ncbi:hypothetical protein [Deinococcus roseus]|uniref:Uncharacterized protein n=1 Tax=Deinococcus roseus TaxID=392414 RepID=A0ABQ2DCA8_9DEIO|nr:hypothetical protein [Deinococcus roseus]GGJ52579.1 hypothetical protein GCM10008938_43210 [Deinococcus roseus]
MKKQGKKAGKGKGKKRVKNTWKKKGRVRGVGLVEVREISIYLVFKLLQMVEVQQHLLNQYTLLRDLDAEEL